MGRQSSETLPAVTDLDVDLARREAEDYAARDALEASIDALAMTLAVRDGDLDENLMRLVDVVGRAAVNAATTRSMVVRTRRHLDAAATAGAAL